MVAVRREGDRPRGGSSGWEKASLQSTIVVLVIEGLRVQSFLSVPFTTQDKHNQDTPNLSEKI